MRLTSYALRLATPAVLVLGAASSASKPPASAPAPNPNSMSAAPKRDMREGLKGGLQDAGEAVSNLKIDAKAVSPPGFLGITNSDLAFTDNYAIQGNYNG